jgi:hypothetical protein
MRLQGSSSKAAHVRVAELADAAKFRNRFVLFRLIVQVQLVLYITDYIGISKYSAASIRTNLEPKWRLISDCTLLPRPSMTDHSPDGLHVPPQT